MQVDPAVLGIESEDLKKPIPILWEAKP